MFALGVLVGICVGFAATQFLKHYQIVEKK